MKGQLTLQNYKSYTKEDQQTWSTLFERQVDNLKKDDKVVKEFWEGISKLKINKSEIPDFQEVNKILKPLSNFEIMGVTGLIDDQIFFQLIKNRKFPVTTWIRKPEQIDYIEEPDMFHDLFGHVPFLIHKSYCDLLTEISDAALISYKHNNKWFQDAFVRFYWYSIEFGIILNKENKRQIYGAGILSSFSETNKVFEPETIVKPFSYEILKNEFDKHTLQKFYALLMNEDGGFSFFKGIERLREWVFYVNDQQHGRHNP